MHQRRYDAGCRSITNIDFSKICIKEMMVKTLRQRPQMKWIVMDMTQMTVGYMLSLTLLSQKEKSAQCSAPMMLANTYPDA